MRVLGIGLSHCCGVCLIEDGRIIFAQEEDRFSRRRRQKGWPQMSLSYLMKEFNLSESDIDICVLTDIQTAEMVNRKFNAKKTIVIHHHLAHIMSGWALTQWPDFNVISIDGGGDFGSWLSFAKIRKRELVQWESNCGCSLTNKHDLRRPKFNLRWPGRPFGSYWSAPAVINFAMVDKNGIGGYEGKLMGLAAHGNADNFDRKEAKYDGDFAIKRISDFYYITTKGHPKIGDKKYLITTEGKKVPLAEAKRLRKKEHIILKEHDLTKNEAFRFASNFAAFLQKRTDETISELFDRNFPTDIPVVLTGGTFGNVVTNGMLNQRYKLFVTPPMGDDGMALGAAAWGAYISGIKYLDCSGIYMGYDAGRNDDVDPAKIAEFLVNRDVVGIIDGRMEMGPRALGARTILCDAQDNNVNWTVNERLDRVEYMPFAPVILEEYAGDVLMGWKKEHLSSKHMTLLYQVSPKWQDRIKGVVHVDGSVRPQVLNRNDNPFYYAILQEYFKKTGIPVLINTSFNAHGEPMLRTAEEGMDALHKNRVDILIAGNDIHYAKNNKWR